MIYKESPNKHKRTQKITGIVIHTTVGAYAGAVSWLTNPQSGVSAHYVVKEDGSEITQCVKDDFVAYHAGTVDRPTTPVYKGGNPNEYTIGIENADGGNAAGADRAKQLPTLIKLVYDLCVKHGLPIDKNHICGHKEIRASKTCPGNINVDYVIQEAKKLAGGGTTPPVGGNMTLEELGQKTIDNLKKHKDNLEYGADKHKLDKILEDVDMLNRIFDEMARERAKLIQDKKDADKSGYDRGYKKGFEDGKGQGGSQPTGEDPKHNGKDANGVKILTDKDKKITGYEFNFDPK